MKHEETKGIWLKNGIYWLAGRMVNGVRAPHSSLQTADFNKAVERAAQIRDAPELAPSSGLAGEIVAYLQDKRERKAYSLSTAKSKGYTLAQFAAWLPQNTAPHQVTTERLQAYYDHVLKKHSAATAHKALMDVRAFFRWELEINKTVRANPALKVRTEPVPDSARALFCPQVLVDKLINECPREDLKLVLLLGFECGMRKQEIIQAVPWWFHMDRRSIDMTPTPTMPFNKFKKPRTIPMRQRLYDFLKDYGLRAPFMLRPEITQGKDIYRYDFDVVLQKYVEAQGCTWVTAHVMRHTFASLLVQKGASIYKVAKWMGDTVRVVEKHYGHLAVFDSDIELGTPKVAP